MRMILKQKQGLHLRLFSSCQKEGLPNCFDWGTKSHSVGVFAGFNVGQSAMTEGGVNSDGG